MKYVPLSLVLAICFLILATPVYAEFLHTDILKKFYPFSITGAVAEVEEETTVEETTTTAEECLPLECLLYCEYGYKKDSLGCEMCECNPEPECPPHPESCWCPDGTICPDGKDAESCPIWLPDDCPVEDICPPAEAPLCGVVVGKQAPTCMPEPCPPDMIRIIIYDEKGCPVGTECVPMIINDTIDCPERQTCPDDSTVPCHIEDNNCICDPCRVPEDDIPDGCWQEVDKETGTINIVCEDTICEDISEVKEKAVDCKNSGGKPIIKTDSNGCEYVNCLFGDDETDPDPIDGYDECPSVDEMDLSMRKCREAGMFGAISFEGGCKIVKCVEEREKRCKIIGADMRLKITEECEMRGLEAIKDYDENGCPFFACAGEEFCKKDLVGEAFEKCSVKGGEMIVKKDDMGCIVYSECVERRDERETYVEPMDDVPEPADLLDVAIRLEQLKIELDKLEREADDIADYYASVDDPDEHRFRRASSMFNAITDKIDEIKNELRDNLDTLTPEDMEKVRFEIRSVKESLKDIVYVMLSNSDDVKEMIEVEAAPPEVPVEGTDCGTDVGCFDSAFRICKPVTGTPEGSAGPIVTITGLEGDACVIRVEAPSLTSLPPEMELPPEVAELVGSFIYMDCKITTYPLGIQNPEEDIFPYCEGPMMVLVRAFGSKAIQTHTEPEQFEGPGECASEKECKEFCKTNPDGCLKWCENNPEMCPPKTQIDLKEKTRGRPFVMCTPEGETAFRECGERGGFGESDPSTFHNASKESCMGHGRGCCEEYTGCLMPEMGECGCTLTEGCTVVCSDYSYGQMNCEDHLADGCVWSIGGIEVQPCTGCSNNGVCDVGECSECRDCL